MATLTAWRNQPIRVAPSYGAWHSVIVGGISIFEDIQMQHPVQFPHAAYAGLAADDLGRSDDRPPLVLLHGLTFDRRMWRSALAELEAIDPGRRRSPSTSQGTVTLRLHRRT
jgi:pimeloyl-ACP methyl ester carboxylesterase